MQRFLSTGPEVIAALMAIERCPASEAPGLLPSSGKVAAMLAIRAAFARRTRRSALEERRPDYAIHPD